RRLYPPEPRAAGNPNGRPTCLSVVSAVMQVSVHPTEALASIHPMPNAATSLLLAFDTCDPQFARGFESGRLWALLRERPDKVFQEYARAENVEMILRIADATGRAVRSEELGEGWLWVRFDPAVDCLDEAA